MTTRTRSRGSTHDVAPAAPLVTTLFPKNLKKDDVPRVIAVEHPEQLQDHRVLPTPPTSNLGWYLCKQYCSTPGRRVYYLAAKPCLHVGCMANLANNPLIPSAAQSAVQVATAAKEIAADLEDASSALRNSLGTGTGSGGRGTEPKSSGMRTQPVPPAQSARPVAGHRAVKLPADSAELRHASSSGPGSEPLVSRPARTRDFGGAVVLNINHHSVVSEEAPSIGRASLVAARSDLPRKTPPFTYQHRAGIAVTSAGTQVCGDVTRFPGLRAAPTTSVRSTPVPTTSGGSSVSLNGRPSRLASTTPSSPSDAESGDSVIAAESITPRADAHKSAETPDAETADAGTSDKEISDAETPDAETSGTETPDEETPDEEVTQEMGPKKPRKADQELARLENAARKAQLATKKQEEDERQLEEKAARRAARREEKARRELQEEVRQLREEARELEQQQALEKAAKKADRKAARKTAREAARAAKKQQEEARQWEEEEAGQLEPRMGHPALMGDADMELDDDADELRQDEYFTMDQADLDLTPDPAFDFDDGVFDKSPFHLGERSGRQRLSPRAPAPVKRVRMRDLEDESLDESVSRVSKKRRTNRPAASSNDKPVPHRYHKKVDKKTEESDRAAPSDDDTDGDGDDVDLPQLKFSKSEERNLIKALAKSKQLYDPRDIYVDGKIVVPKEILKALAPGQSVTFRRDKAGSCRPYYTIEGVSMHGPTGVDLGPIRYYRVALKHSRSSENKLKRNIRTAMERIITNLSKLEEQTGAEAVLFVKPPNDHAQIYGTQTFREGIEDFGTKVWKWGTDHLASVADEATTEELAVQAEATGSKRAGKKARVELQRREDKRVAAAAAVRKSHSARKASSNAPSVDGDESEDE